MSYRDANVVFSSLYIGVRECGVLFVKKELFHNRFIAFSFFTLASYSYKAHRKVWRAQKRTRVARSA